MARRSVIGQLNMFDLFNSIDMGEPGEVEMVSLMPDFDVDPEEQNVVKKTQMDGQKVGQAEVFVDLSVKDTNEEPQVQVTDVEIQDENEKATMSRSFEIEGSKIEIAYINYNKVRITRDDETPVIKEFSSTKEAVDYYVEQMQGFAFEE